MIHRVSRTFYSASPNVDILYHYSTISKAGHWEGSLQTENRIMSLLCLPASWLPTSLRINSVSCVFRINSVSCVLQDPLLSQTLALPNSAVPLFTLPLRVPPPPPSFALVISSEVLGGLLPEVLGCALLSAWCVLPTAVPSLFCKSQLKCHLREAFTDHPISLLPTLGPHFFPSEH